MIGYAQSIIAQFVHLSLLIETSLTRRQNFVSAKSVKLVVQRLQWYCLRQLCQRLLA